MRATTRVIHTIGAGTTACAAAFMITMMATEDLSLETVYRGSNLIVRANTYITAQELDVFEISHRDAYPKFRLIKQYREKTYAVYEIEKL